MSKKRKKINLNVAVKHIRNIKFPVVFLMKKIEKQYMMNLVEKTVNAI